MTEELTELVHRFDNGAAIRLTERNGEWESWVIHPSKRESYEGCYGDRGTAYAKAQKALEHTDYSIQITYDYRVFRGSELLFEEKGFVTKDDAIADARQSIRKTTKLRTSDVYEVQIDD